MKQVWCQFGPFTEGIDNVNDVRSLSKKALREAVDCDVDNTGSLDARPIIKTVHTTASHSLFGNKDKSLLLVVEGTALRRINSDNTRTTIYSGITAGVPMSYVEYLNMIYLSNGQIIGKTDGHTVTLLSSADTRPYKDTVKPGNIIEVHNDRLYTIVGGCIQFSDAKSVETRDRRFCRIFVPGNITMFKSMNDGIWLSFGGKTYFISGLDPTDQFTLIEKADYGSLGQAVEVPRELLIPSLQGFGGKTIAWMSERGGCIGGDGGTMINLSARKYAIASGMRIAANFLRITNSGIGHFISAMKN